MIQIRHNEYYKIYLLTGNQIIFLELSQPQMSGCKIGKWRILWIISHFLERYLKNRFLATLVRFLSLPQENVLRIIWRRSLEFDTNRKYSRTFYSYRSLL